MTDQGTAVGSLAEDSDPVAPEQPATTRPNPVPDQPRVRMRQRIARLGAAKAQTPALDPLFQVIKFNHPKADLGIIERAYTVAERAHRGQMRKSGDTYITHPVAVATILAELGMTTATLAAALLHDTVEDTEYSIPAAPGSPPAPRTRTSRPPR